MWIDLNNKDISWKPGTYPATITSCSRKAGRHTGRDCLAFKFEIFDPRFEGDPTVHHTTVVSGPGRHHLDDILSAVREDATEGGFDTDRLIGRRLFITIGTNDIPLQNGKPNPYPQVKGVAPITEHEVTP